MSTYRIDHDQRRGLHSHAIHELVEGLQQAWNAGDEDALARLFWEDADWTDWHGRHRHGRAGLQQDPCSLFAPGRAARQLTLHILNMRFLSDAVVAVHVDVHIRRLASPGLLDLQVAALLLLTRRRRAWRCEILHSVPLAEPD